MFGTDFNFRYAPAPQFSQTFARDFCRRGAPRDFAIAFMQHRLAKPAIVTHRSSRLARGGFGILLISVPRYGLPLGDDPTGLGESGMENLSRHVNQPFLAASSFWPDFGDVAASFEGLPSRGQHGQCSELSCS